MTKHRGLADITDMQYRLEGIRTVDPAVTRTIDGLMSARYSVITLTKSKPLPSIFQNSTPPPNKR